MQDGKYKVIKSPIDLAECKSDDVRSFLGRSEKGVYFAAIDPMDILRVWILRESSDHYGKPQIAVYQNICRVRKHGHTANLPFAVCQQKQHKANGWHTTMFVLFGVPYT